MKENSKIVSRVVLCVILAVGMMVTAAVYIITHWVEKNVVTEISEYESYFGEKGIHRTKSVSRSKKTSESYLVSCDIFPEKLPESAEEEEFYYEYYDPWDPCYLCYLVYRCDEEDYDAETERLQRIGVPEDYLIYGTTGFPYPLLAVDASNLGYIYAMGDEDQGKIIYVELTFTDHFMDIDYEKVIPTEYLPIGFDAKMGNPVQLEYRAQIEGAGYGDEGSDS